MCQFKLNREINCVNFADRRFNKPGAKVRADMFPRINVSYKFVQRVKLDINLKPVT